MFVLAGALTFAPWLIRNVVWAGNPVFPEAASVLGKGHFSDVQVERWKRAHAPRADQRSVAARPEAARREIVADWRYGWVVLPAGVILGALACTRASDRPNAWPILALLGLLLIFWLGFTHLQSRFFVFGVPLAALLIARAPWRWWPGVAVVLFSMPAAMTWVRAGAALDERFLAIRAPEDLPILAAAGDEALAEQVRSAKGITLVGDARAFWYSTPPGGLRYRTVFDVDPAVGGGNDPVSAWTGGQAAGGPAGDLTVIDPSELRRFADTYAGIPRLPGAYRERNRPFVLSAGD